jgi:putative component of toxin-antitoxin plasmid stabilization module
VFKLFRSHDFDVWLRDLLDHQAKAIVLARLNRAGLGNLGDCGIVGRGIVEMRVHFGAGYPGSAQRFLSTHAAAYTVSTSSAISPQQERTEPSGPRRCRRGAKSSLRREPNMPADLLRALFGDVIVPERVTNGNHATLLAQASDARDLGRCAPGDASTTTRVPTGVF